VHADYTAAARWPPWTGCCPCRIHPRRFVANVASAVGVLYALHPGLSVPHDLSVAAVHDMPLASHLGAALTTSADAAEELGRAALELLALRGPDDPDHRGGHRAGGSCWSASSTRCPGR